MSFSMNVHGVISMNVKSELIPREDGAPFYVTWLTFLNADGIESHITVMHADKPVTLDGAEFMNFTIAAELEPA